MRNLFRRLDGWLFALLLLLGAGAIGYLGTRYAHQSDWTANGRTSLSSASRAVLAALDGPVQIVSYASPQGSLRQAIAGFVQRYQQVKPDLSLRFVDPQLDPAKMRELGITVDGALIVHYRGREQRLDELSEESLTNALERLIRGDDRVVAFVTGDGERNADGKANADLGTFMSQLEQRGMRAVPLNFAQVNAVPQHTDLVVLASPAVPLAPAAVQALVAYVQDGGSLLWLSDPGNHDLGLQPLAAALGIRVLPGVLVDGSGAALGLHDPRMLALGDYPLNAITRGFTLTTLFPQVSALARVAQPGDWAVVPFLRSSAQSWTEFKPIDNSKPSEIRFDATLGELKGPLDFGFALSRLSPSPDKSEQRAVVIGDGDFLSNTYLGNGGNRALGERVFDWLLGDDKLVNLPPRGAPDRLLQISQGELSALSFGFLIALPLLLLAGWQLRRDALNAPGALTALDPAAITRVALTLPGAPTLHYEKRAGHWWRTDGTPARAIDSRLDDLTAIAAAPVLSWRPASDFDPAKIGLAPPQAVLVLDGHALEFGATAVTGPQHYVRVGRRIALVSPRYMPSSPATRTTELH